MKLNINWGKIGTFGLISGFIFGIIIIFLIFSGNTYSLVPMDTILGVKYFPIGNPYFDYSVVGMFSCFLIFAGSTIIKEEDN